MFIFTAMLNPTAGGATRTMLSPPTDPVRAVILGSPVPLEALMDGSNGKPFKDSDATVTKSEVSLINRA